MSDIRETMSTALRSVYSNSWLVELPPEPTFPAIVFRVDTEQEEQWCFEGGYDQHLVSVVLLSRDADWFPTIAASVVSALEALPSYMFEESRGDGEYEDDPEVFAFAILFRLRTPRY
jgi:hypothetical protein